MLRLFHHLSRPVGWDLSDACKVRGGKERERMEGGEEGELKEGGKEGCLLLSGMDPALFNDWAHVPGLSSAAGG